MKTLLTIFAVSFCTLLSNSTSFAVQEDWVQDDSVFQSISNSNQADSAAQKDLGSTILNTNSHSSIQSGGEFRAAGYPRPGNNFQDQDAPKTTPTEIPLTPQERNRVDEFMAKSIRSISIDIREKSAKYPEDRSVDLINRNVLDWSHASFSNKVFAWTAPNIRYQPLYFEQVALERYGQTPCGYKEFVATATHFYTSALLLPLHMRETPPKSCDYPLGFCRPGNVNPYVTEQLWYGQPLRFFSYDR